MTSLPDPLFHQPEMHVDRDKMLHFNTRRFGHCFFDPLTKKLYNEYDRLLMNDAVEYLLSTKLMNEKLEQLDYFEE
jgi:hypothetical protein